MLDYYLLMVGSLLLKYIIHEAVVNSSFTALLLFSGLSLAGQKELAQAKNIRASSHAIAKEATNSFLPF